MNAQVVYERHSGVVGGEPFSYERVGIRIAERVIWLGMIGPYLSQVDYTAERDLAEQVVRRWNIIGPEAECRTPACSGTARYFVLEKDFVLLCCMKCHGHWGTNEEEKRIARGACK